MRERRFILKEGCDLTLNSLRKWAKGRPVMYKIPNQICIGDKLPCNVVGKIFKPKVVQFFKTEKRT